MASLTHDDYTIAWISALPLEMAAASVMLDKTHNPLPQPVTDPNAYVLGELSGHCIVMACLPTGVYGTISAATVMSHMISTFSSDPVWFDGGNWRGVPSTSNDIRLGDVVVSKPVGKYSGVIQYDYGKAVQGGQFEPTGTLNKPPQTLLTHMAYLEATQMTKRDDAVAKIVLETLGLQDVRTTDIKEQIKIHLSSGCAGKWLMVFDNADNVNMWLLAGDAAPILEELLPESEQGRILFTTRNRKLTVDLTSSNIVPIPHGDKEIILKIFEKSLVQNRLLEDHITTVSLLKQLTFLPLAITQASAYINKNCLSLPTYLALLQEQESEVVDLLSEDFKDPGYYKDIQNPVITTWLISFKQIHCQDQLAADYLSFMACINPRNIPQSLLPPPTSRKHKIDALGLLNVKDGPEHPNTLTSMANLASTFWNQGRWNEAEKLELEVLETRKAVLGAEHPDTLTSMANLAATYPDQGRWNEAEKLFGRWSEAEKLEMQVMETSETVLGAEHPSTLRSIMNLAGTYRNQGRWNEAEKLEVQVMEISKTVLGAEHPDTLSSVVNLASTYWNQGQWNEAEKLLMQVMDTSETVLGADHPSTLRIMANLGATYCKQGRWSEAEKLQIQVMKTRKAALGAEHPDTLITMNNLAATYRNQGRWNEAEKLLTQVLEIYKTVLGEEHPDTLRSMANLAETYRSQERWSEADKIFMQLMETRKTVLGAEHPDTLTIMASLAYTRKSQGKLQDASALMAKCSELRIKVLGPDHPDSKSSTSALGNWKDMNNSLPNKITQAVPSQIELSQYQHEVSAGHTIAAVVALALHEEHNKPSYMRTRPAAELSLRNHPLIMACRTSPATGGQDLREVD
ncbi:hypothetical protein ETB97_005646 [Aspergillus alliaceus]|uniref:Uncharacterized protein n=1 Tax=Petromyces alliaceus TaxID=209559 RepID=A0A8H5ZVC5_PETAA|nr:hypothetical protein ETB97_005646 [Aspergillus burnettii]